MDNFYTSLKLLNDLDQKCIMACEMMREGRRHFPTVNKLGKRAKRGDIRWLRVEKLLLLRWMNHLHQSPANFHQAFSGFSTSRRVTDNELSVELMSSLQRL